MTTPKIEEIVEDFEKWVYSDDVHDVWISYTNVVERFKKALTSQRQTLRDEIGKMKRYVQKYEDEISADFYHRTGYNQAIADVLALLDNN